MSTSIYNRVAKITGNNSCALLMLIGEQHKQTFRDILMKTSAPLLRKYYFAYMFESLEGRNFETGMHHHIKNIELVTEPINYHGELLYPIRADLEISLGTLYGLRAKYKDRASPFPGFQELDGGA